MFENKALDDISSRMREMNYLLMEIARLLRDMNDKMPYCSCNDEHAVGVTWTCVFHGTVTRAE